MKAREEGLGFDRLVQVWTSLALFLTLCPFTSHVGSEEGHVVMNYLGAVYEV